MSITEVILLPMSAWFYSLGFSLINYWMAYNWGLSDMIQNVSGCDLFLLPNVFGA